MRKGSLVPGPSTSTCPLLCSHLEADLPGLSEQGLRGQVGVRVRPPQVRGAACGLDGHLVRGRGFQPGWRVWRRTETPRVHGRVVEFFATSVLPVALHRPELRGEREGETKMALTHEK